MFLLREKKARTIKAFFLLVLAFSTIELSAEEIDRLGSEPNQEMLDWYSQAKFGMFIHWGVYSVNGEAAWSRYKKKIPHDAYHAKAAKFNPINFDAEAWVRLAKSAGMKWITITAKHHDGFSIYPSEFGGFDTGSSTPFKRDVLKELKEACDKHGLKLGFYYSQFQDWDYPGGGDLSTKMIDANEIEAFDRYTQEKALPQVRELITRYDPFTIWFDTPAHSFLRHSLENRKAVNDAAPGTLICGRVGRLQGDYLSFPDNTVPSLPVAIPWETCMISTAGWGYRKKAEDPDAGKPPAVLIKNLCEIASRGGNFLLNMGPRLDGGIPGWYPKNFGIIGEWMKVHGEAIYGTSGNPFTSTPTMLCTTKGNKLYLFFMTQKEATTKIHGYDGSDFIVQKQASGTLALDEINHYDLTDLAVPVTKAYFLSDPTTELSFSAVTVEGQPQTRIELPDGARDSYASVLVIETDGPVKASSSGVPIQTDGGKVIVGADDIYPSMNHKFVERINVAREKGEVPFDNKTLCHTLDSHRVRNYASFDLREPGTYRATVRLLLPNGSAKGFVLRIGTQYFSTEALAASSEIQEIVVDGIELSKVGLQTMVLCARRYETPLRTEQIIGIESIRLTPQR
jgi:alpha-L-fucosidase